MNNDIQQLSRPGQLRLVNLDFDSPRLLQAMKINGYEKQDLEYSKRKDNFREGGDDSAFDPQQKGSIALVNSMVTIEREEIDDTIINLRFKHYQNRLIDRINRVLRTRKEIKMRQHAREQLQSIISNNSGKKGTQGSIAGSKLMPAQSVPLFQPAMSTPSMQNSVMLKKPSVGTTAEASVMSQLPMLKSRQQAFGKSTVIGESGHETI